MTETAERTTFARHDERQTLALLRRVAVELPCREGVTVHRRQIFGPAIRHLRLMAASDSSPDEIDAFLRVQMLDDRRLPAQYLGLAFLQGSAFTFMGSADPAAPAEARAAWKHLVAEHEAEWKREPIPELMRLRDYFSFMLFAQSERVTVAVRGANPKAGAWIGRPDVRCYDGDLPVLSRETSPHEGLLAADRGDARLAALLAGYEPALSYEGYLAQLEARGLRVRGSKEGYVLEDTEGRRMHEPYRLHGVYDPESRASAWTSKRGERLRASLNRHLGAELVRFGPHDDWELRNDRRAAGPLYGPQAPVVVFDEDQAIDRAVSARALSRLEPYFVLWNDMYPHHPIEKKRRS